MDIYNILPLGCILFLFFLVCLLVFLLIRRHLLLTQERLHNSDLSKRLKALMKNFSAIAQQKDDLERINEMRSKFISVTAHDLKQPITLINGYSSLLRETLSQENLKLLDNIDKATSTIERLTRDLGDVSSAQYATMKLSKSKFIFNDFIEEIFKQYKSAAAQKKISLLFTPYPEPIEINADLFRFEQVFSNLLSNALKFTLQDGTIEIRYTLEENKIKVLVKDDGLGITPTDRIKIFDKFQQSDFIDENFKKQGWGLGLAIAKEIINAHGGEIGADSAGRGTGSTFWLTIPLANAK